MVGDAGGSPTRLHDAVEFFDEGSLNEAVLGVAAEPFAAFAARQTWA